MPDVVLVNAQDEPVGVMEKMEAHRKPHLHRAFSIFLFNSNGEMLLQQRAMDKYHSPGLWTNACCSHPYPGEAIEEAANRRLMEELGIETQLTKAFSFTYQAEFENGLYEHEYDHVFVGEFHGTLHPNPQEVGDYCYKSIAAIKADLENKPASYTPWFKIAMPYLENHLSGLPVNGVV
jgi:isopentenyl-diphosphate delta-isomerase